MKFSDAVTICKQCDFYEGKCNLQAGDMFLKICGCWVYVISPADADKFNSRKKIPEALYVIAKPIRISTDELMLLLPGLFAFVPYHGHCADYDAMSEILIPDLSVETDFKNNLKSIKADFEIENEAIRMKERFDNKKRCVGRAEQYQHP